LVKLDNICQQCDLRFFEIGERECPVCEGEDFVEVKRSIIKDDTDGNTFENFELKCNQCETPSVLKIKMNKEEILKESLGIHGRKDPLR